MGKPSTEKQSRSNGRDGRGRFTRGHRHGFQPGQSGNPQGRPKAVTLSEALRAKLAEVLSDERTVAEALAVTLIKAAASGNVQAIREVADRTEGRPRQSVDVDMNVYDWRELARRHGLSERDVVAEAKRIIESDFTGGDAPVN